VQNTRSRTFTNVTGSASAYAHSASASHVDTDRRQTNHAHRCVSAAHVDVDSLSREHHPIAIGHVHGEATQDIRQRLRIRAVRLKPAGHTRTVPGVVGISRAGGLRWCDALMAG
jgi:hypothetical protein